MNNLINVVNNLLQCCAASCQQLLSTTIVHSCSRSTTIVQSLLTTINKLFSSTIVSSFSNNIVTIIALCQHRTTIDRTLYNNTCSFCIFICRELCVIRVHTHEWRQLMAWSNLANLFRGSSHDFCQLYDNIKQIDFIFLCFCIVIDHTWRHSVWRTKSHGTRLRLVRTFLFFTRYDVICDLLQYRRTQTWNLFVKYSSTLWI